MAEVWTARRIGNDGEARLVALKTIRSDLADNDEMRRMFLTEAHTVGRIRHANVVEVIEIGEHDGVLFIAMDLIEGDSLAGLLRAQAASADGPALPWPVAVRLCADVAAGLHAAHSLTDEQGVPMKVVHRDVSPQNVLIGLDGVARIVDFGVAKSLGPQLRDSTPGRLKGKVGYAAPEQLCAGRIDHRVDIFALGVVLWESLTGLRLFRANDVAGTVERVLTLPIPPLGEILPSLPHAVVDVVERALEREPSRRFSSAAAMHDALALALRTSQVTHDDIARLVAARLGPIIALRRRAIDQSIHVFEPSAPSPQPLEETWNSVSPQRRSQHVRAMSVPRRRPSLGSVLSLVSVLLGAALAFWPFEERPAALAPSALSSLPHAGMVGVSSVAPFAVERGVLSPPIAAPSAGAPTTSPTVCVPAASASSSSTSKALVSTGFAQTQTAPSAIVAAPDSSSQPALPYGVDVDVRNPYTP